MGAKLRAMIGERFGRLTIISFAGSVHLYGGKKRIWNCLCDCGSTTQLPTSALENGNTQSCGCLHKETSPKNAQKTRYLVARVEAGFNNVFKGYQRNAVKRNLTFSLDESTFRGLIESCCHYCGAPPANCNTKFYHEYFYNGVDRMDNSLGYTKENCVSCCGICNHAKHTLSYNSFVAWILRAGNHLNDPGSTG